MFISKKLRTFAQAKLREYRNFASKSMKYPFKKMSIKPKRNPLVEYTPISKNPIQQIAQEAI
uniref:hypothetical protein n=1 Tax=Alloprevotella sp. TaxID=1872471 RepID=UPI004027AE6E